MFWGKNNLITGKSLIYSSRHMPIYNQTQVHVMTLTGGKERTARAAVVAVVMVVVVLLVVAAVEVVVVILAVQ